MPRISRSTFEAHRISSPYNTRSKTANLNIAKVKPIKVEPIKMKPVKDVVKDFFTTLKSILESLPSEWERSKYICNLSHEELILVFINNDGFFDESHMKQLLGDECSETFNAALNCFAIPTFVKFTSVKNIVDILYALEDFDLIVECIFEAFRSHMDNVRKFVKTMSKKDKKNPQNKHRISLIRAIFADNLEVPYGFDVNESSYFDSWHENKVSYDEPHSFEDFVEEMDKEKDEFLAFLDSIQFGI